MCGILGNIRRQSKIEVDQFKSQLDLIKHRGPDDSGVYINENIGLGSVRLAIQDLSLNGHMPMFSRNKNLSLVFNGEIYNFKDIRDKLKNLGYEFNSNTDTEVVLYSFEEWGVKALDYLEGMFAIAIFNKEENTVFLARDRAGEKPLYYTIHEKKSFYFCSELKPILLDKQIPRKLNSNALNSYLNNGYIGPDECFVDGFLKLKPGHYLIFDINTFEYFTKPYWKIPSPNTQKIQLDELIFEGDRLLNKAVKNQLIADVPLGILLSGGVDSSLITAYAAANSVSKLKTFHVSFSGQKKYNEAEYASQIARYFETDHTEINGNEINYELIDNMANIYSEPLADSSMIPTYLVSAAIKEHVTVALGGDGGDELFGGYTTYKSILNHNNIELIPNVFRKGIGLIAEKFPMGIKGRNFALNLEGSMKKNFFRNRLFDEYSKSKILKKKFLEETQFDEKEEFENNPLFYMTKNDFHNYLPNDILFKVDQASMAVSLELRTPFLDKNVIEFAFGKVPSNMKADTHNLKFLTKEILKTKIKMNYDYSRKQGFSIPLNEWLGGKWYKNAQEDINELPEIFNIPEILRSLENIKKGYTNSSRIYSLLILSKWLKKNEIEY